MVEKRPLALVTGSSSGIGRAYAKELAAQGFDLLLVARRWDRLEALAKNINEAYGIEAEVLVADLSDLQDLHRVEQRIAEEKGLAMLVNNAGLGGIKPFLEMDSAYIQKMIAVNVTAVTLLTYAALPGMVQRRSGTIVNLSSGLAYTRMPGVAVYAATKAFVAQFTRILHDEYGSRGIRFQALLPGLTRTELGSGQQPPDLMERIPADQISTPERAAKASLAGLELGELMCIPGLAHLEEFVSADRSVQEVLRKVQAKASPRYHPFMSKEA
jgi:short-subunit dehydrogenase